MSRFASIGSSLQTTQKAIEGATGDISAAAVEGYKGSDDNFAAQVITQGGRTVVSGVSINARRRIDLQGAIAASGVATHVAVNGDGFIPVAKSSDGDSEVLLTRVGSFEVDHKGNLVNRLGYVAMGKKLDDAGNPVGAADNLTAINIRGLSGRAKATENVSFDMKLNSGAAAIKGAGQVMVFSADDKFNGAIGEDHVIIPNGDNINLDDQIALKVGDETRTYKFGGVSSSFCMKGAQIFGQGDVTKTFATAAVGPAVPGVAVEGDKLTVKVGDAGEVIELKFKSSNPLAANREFNSLSTLRDALNNVPGLTARIHNDTLYVAAKDGTQSITFNNSGAGNTDFKSNLGLSNILSAAAPNAGDARRFSTLGELRKLLTADGLVIATKTTQGNGIDISAKDPLQKVTFTGKAERKNAINYVSVTGDDGAGAASVTIMAANHGLKIGDYVRLNGLDTNNRGFAGGNATADGIYYVTGETQAGFTVSTTRAIAVGVGPGQVPLNTTITFGAAGTWQKTTGAEVGPAVNFGGGNVSRNGAGVVTIVQGHGFNADDVIYVSGLGLQNGINIPDGYYRVLNEGGGANFTIGGAGSLVAGGVVGAGGGAARGTFRKIGNSGGAPNSIMTATTFIDSPTAVPGNNRVRVFMPHHLYSADDYVRIGGTPLVGAGADEINGKNFKVVASGENWFEFDTDTQAGRDALTGGVFADGSLPADNFIDRFGKLDKDLKLRQDKDGVAFDEAYKPGNEEFGLVSGNIKGTWEQAVALYDSQGNPHDFKIAFAKVGNNKWAVEIYTPADPNGEYDIEIDNKNGVLATGYINFDGQGRVLSIEGAVNGAIPIRWKNGANPSSVTFNWGDPGNADVALTNGGVRQTRGENSVSFIDQDGYKPGKFIGLVVDGASGDFIANFDNGQKMAIFRLPLAYVAAPNELEVLSDGLLRVTAKSGGVLYKKSGDEGVGTYEGSASEGSNVDSTASTIDLTAKSGQYSYVVKALSTVIKTEDKFLNSI